MESINIVGTKRLIRTERLDAHLASIKEDGGVYFAFIKGGRDLLSKSGYFESTSSEPLRIDGADLMYIGGTDRGLQTRIKQHIRGDARVSSLRKTLGCLLMEELELSMHHDISHINFSFGSGEVRLSEWIARHSLFAFHVQRPAIRCEKFLIRTLRPPLNISFLRSDRYAKYLMDIRKSLRRES